MTRHQAKLGFTLIELLAVVIIMVILASMLLAVVPMVRQAARDATCRAIVDLVTEGLTAAEAERQSLPLVPHPFAGTANPAPHLPFRRGAIDPIRLLPRFRSLRDGYPLPVDLAGGDASRALWSFAGADRVFDGVTPVQVGPAPIDRHYVLGGEGRQFVGATDPDQVLMGNDVLAAPQLPLAYGAKRELLQVLGAAYPTIHRHFLCPGRDAETNYVNASLDIPQLSSAIERSRYFTSEIYPDVAGSGSGNYSGADGRRRGRNDSEAAARGALQAVWERLSKLEALEEVGPGPLGLGGRIHRGTAGDGWQPGRVEDAGDWVDYTLPWVAPVDIWGNELLISRAADGRLRVISAGRDGCLRIHPGPDGRYQTGSGGFGRRVLAFDETWSDGQRSGGLDGDDRDATADNVVQGVIIDDYRDRLTAAEAAALGVLP